MRTLTFANAINEALRQEMRRNPKVYIAGEDVGLYGGIYGATASLFAEFGEERVKDTPISESAIIGMAVGSATAREATVRVRCVYDVTATVLRRECDVVAM